MAIVLANPAEVLSRSSTADFALGIGAGLSAGLQEFRRAQERRRLIEDKMALEAQKNAARMQIEQQRFEFNKELNRQRFQNQLDILRERAAFSGDGITQGQEEFLDGLEGGFLGITPDEFQLVKEKKREREKFLKETSKDFMSAITNTYSVGDLSPKTSLELAFEANQSPELRDEILYDLENNKKFRQDFETAERILKTQPENVSSFLRGEIPLSDLVTFDYESQVSRRGEFGQQIEQSIFNRDIAIGQAIEAGDIVLESLSPFTNGNNISPDFVPPSEATPTAQQPMEASPKDSLLNYLQTRASGRERVNQRYNPAGQEPLPLETE